ncbi:hypothetical protein [Streptomyces sp. 2P-4]|uniref:hypothetical protein n=1 Tax=Streptomyces sp. 2P-4 TaxID=2931974 RepID=UPI0025402E7E|nr:hypothetical protein [Streptomyces sp. 2P-4]
MTLPADRRFPRRRLVLASAGLAAVAGLGVLPFATRADAGTPDLARTALAARDGWASSGSGTTGGQAADAAHDTTVTTWAELVKALRAGPSGAPRIIRIKGRIDANTDDQGRRLDCADCAKGAGYTLAAYLKAYDPAVWGRSELPAGAQEPARAAAQARQAERIAIAVPSNTTVVGVPGTDAGINGGSLLVQKADNVVYRWTLKPGRTVPPGGARLRRPVQPRPGPAGPGRRHVHRDGRHRRRAAAHGHRPVPRTGRRLTPYPEPRPSPSRTARAATSSSRRPRL